MRSGAVVHGVRIATVRRSLSVLLVITASLTAAAAQSVLAVLEANRRIENRLFDGELRRYDETRLREREALQALRVSSNVLDREIKRSRPRLDQLELLEAEVAQAREAAYGVSRELSDLRQQLYARMARLAELDAEIQRERGRQLVPQSQLDGFWHIEFQPTGEIGLLKLRVQGTLITGNYRLSGRRIGSVRGTLANDRVELERIDNSSGFDSEMVGEFNPATRRITGRWTAVDVSGGRQGGGTWEASKLSPAEEENLQVEQVP